MPQSRFLKRNLLIPGYQIYSVQDQDSIIRLPMQYQNAALVLLDYRKAGYSNDYWNEKKKEDTPDRP